MAYLCFLEVLKGSNIHPIITKLFKISAEESQNLRIFL